MIREQAALTPMPKGIPDEPAALRRSVEDELGIVRRSLSLCADWIEPRIAAITATSYNLADETHLLVNATAAAVTVNLPPAAEAVNRLLTVKKTDASASAVVVDGYSSETIDGATSISITTQYDARTMVCDGTAWHLVGVYP